MTRRALAAAALGLVALGGCGGFGGISSSASADLTSRVAEVRAAVADGDRDAAEQALSDLRLVVLNLSQRGELTEDKADAILDATTDVRATLSLMPTTTTTTFPIDDDDDDDEGNGNGNGKGKGKSGKD